MVALALFGVVVWAFDVEGFWQTLGVIFIGAPVAIFVSTWGSPSARRWCARGGSMACSAEHHGVGNVTGR